MPSQQSPQSRQSEDVEVEGLVTWRSPVQYHRVAGETGPMTGDARESPSRVKAERRVKSGTDVPISVW